MVISALDRPSTRLIETSCTIRRGLIDSAGGVFLVFDLLFKASLTQ
jgi:hypothetical protein